MTNSNLNITKRFRSERVKTARGRKISSTKWLNRQLNDPYVKEAQERGYRSRAAFKILEINEKFKIFKKGYKVVDLGSAPGGWSQVVVGLVGENNVLATDILDMPAIAGVKFIKKNFLDDDAEDQIISNMDNKKCDVIMSDMAANTTGDKKTDQLRTSNLIESAIFFAKKVLKENGVFVAKVFQGGTEKNLFDILKANFKTVKHFKPNSSRKESKEIYVVAMGFRG